MKPSALLAPALLVVLGGQVTADSLEVIVTPTNLKHQSPALEVSVHEADGLNQFTILVKGWAGEEARFLQWPTLILVKGDKTIACCPVARAERKGDVVFSFGVSPDFLAGASFKVTAIAHVRTKDKQGKERWAGMPSGTFMTFPLADFAKRK
jgi:hypothetical protein